MRMLNRPPETTTVVMSPELLVREGLHVKVKEGMKFESAEFENGRLFVFVQTGPNQYKAYVKDNPYNRWSDEMFTLHQNISDRFVKAEV